MPNATPTQRAKELGAAIPRLLEVKDVKKVLSQLGYYNGPLNNDPDDAYFQAVVNFQHSKAIVQDGLVGGETYGKLREAAPWYFGDKQQVGDAKTASSAALAFERSAASCQQLLMHYAENPPIKLHLSIGLCSIFKALALTDADLWGAEGS